MGLIFNHMSASVPASKGILDGQNRAAAAMSGSMYFSPAGNQPAAELGAEKKSLRGFSAHPDSAYIFSGTVGGNDKALFLGDLVVSGNLSLGSGASFVDAAADAAATRIAVFDDTNTVGGDVDLLFIAAGDKAADSGGQGRLELGDTAGDDVSIKLAAGDIQFFADDDLGAKIGGLVTNSTTKLAITGALAPVAGTSFLQGVEVVSDAGIGIVQGSSGGTHRAAGFISVRAVGSTGSAGSAAPALLLKADAGGIEIDALKDIEIDGAAKISIDGANNSADAVVINASAGGLDLLAAGGAGEDIDIVNTAGSVNITGGESAADSVKVTGTGVQILSSDTSNGLKLATGTSGVPITIGHGTSETTVADNLTVNGTSTLQGNTVIGGNLDVNGTTTTIDAANTSITDGLIVLNSGSDASPANRDQGIIFAAPDVSRTLFVDITDSNKFKFAQTYTSGSAAAIVPLADADVEMGVLTATSIVIDDGLTIGSASDTDAIAISSGGDVTLTQDLLFANGKTLGSAGTTDLVTVNANDLTVKGTKSIKVDVIDETTGDAGVTIEGVSIIAGSGTTTLGVSNDINLMEITNSSGHVAFTNTGAASSSTSGGVIFGGGVGIADDLYIGDNLSLSSDAALLSIGSSSSNVDLQHVAGAVSVVTTSNLSDSSTRASGFSTSALSSPSSFTAGTTTLQYSSGIPSSLSEGEYIIFRNSSSASVAFRVTASASGGATSVSVEYVSVNSFSSSSGYTSSGGNADVSGSGASTSGFSAVFKDTGNPTPTRVLKALQVNGASQLQFRQTANVIHSSDSGLLDLEAATKIIFGVSGEVLSVDSNSVNLTQALLPSSDNAINIGSASARFANIFTGDLNLRNDRGDWTLIEENDFISFRNNKTGRRFRMVMEDITGLGNYGPGNDGEM